MIHYKSIDQSQFAEGTDIKEQERVFDGFLQDTLLEIQGSHINKTNRIPHNVHISNQPDEEVPYIFLKTCNRSEIYYGEGEVPDEVAPISSVWYRAWNQPSLAKEPFRDR